MKTNAQFPLRAREDAIKRALVLNGFKLIDDGDSQEVESSDWTKPLFRRSEGHLRKPIVLEGGLLALRSELLAAQAGSIRGQLPLKAFACGNVYDGNDVEHPRYRVMEGVIVATELNLNKASRLAAKVAREAFGMGIAITTTQTGAGSLAVDVTVDERTFTFAQAGKATPLARVLLGIDGSTDQAWLFEIVVDDIAVAMEGLGSRNELLSPLETTAHITEGSSPAYGSESCTRALDALRAMRFREVAGDPIYEADCYKKMNMIQESWDKNNRGIKLGEAMGDRNGLPTVLVPAIEEALAANWKAGCSECRIFTIGHIFLPGNGPDDHIEKAAVCFGAYAPNLDKDKWREIVGDFLDRFGFKGHYFIKLPDGAAPAYDTSDGNIIMDQTMAYMESNFGSINSIALANHGIDTQAFVAHIELAYIEKKAEEELDFILPDYQ